MRTAALLDAMSARRSVPSVSFGLGCNQATSASAIIGGIATMIIGFNAGGWYLGSSAETMAETRSEVAVIDALVPICISKQQVDPEAIGKLKELTAMRTSYEQRDFVMKAGWATMPSTDAPNRDLATACADALSKAIAS